MAKDKDFYVYMHINKINDKKYIGITKDYMRRWRNNGNEYRDQLFGSAIKKYGWDNFDHIILYENLTKEEACKKEIELIEEYNTADSDYGYNVSLGGDGVNRAFKKIYQYSTDGIFLYEFDNIKEILCKYNLKSPGNIYACCIGKRSSSFGFIWSYVYLGDKIDKLEDPHERTAKSERIPVYQYDLNGNYIKKFKSGTEVYKELGISVDPCLRNITSSARGFQWFREYKGEKIESILSSSEKLGERQSKKVYLYDKNYKLLKIFNRCKDICDYFKTYHKKIKYCIDNNILYENKYYISHSKI